MRGSTSIRTRSGWSGGVERFRAWDAEQWLGIRTSETPPDDTRRAAASPGPAAGAPAG